MGGQALKTVKVRRYSKKEYERLSEIIKIRLKSLGIKSRVPLSFGAKETFGDLDVLIKSSSISNRVMREIIEDTFNPHEIYHNGSVYSFDYKEFQIDFILVPDGEWETSYHYFSYNDLGNLIGRISYQMGFRYGHYGLKLVYRHDDGGKKFEKTISKNMFDTLQFLGFDPDVYAEGFHELTDIFDYVIGSTHFNPKIFQYEALNHQNKTRNKKRVNYAEFLEYVEKQNFKNRELYEYQDKDFYVKMAEDYFDINIVDLIEDWNKVVEKDKLVSTKFNGHIIMKRYPDLKGKELGNAITKFKNYIKPYLSTQAMEKNEVGSSDVLFKEFIINTDIEHIFKHFKNINNL